MSIIKTNIESLHAVAPFISSEKTRYYLTGVNFENDLLVATDGHILAAIKPYKFEGKADPSFILPGETVKKILTTKPKTKYIPVFVEIDTEKNTTSVIQENNEERITLVTYPFTPIARTFPDWRRVCPSEITNTGAATGFNSKLLGRFKSFGDKIYFSPNKEDRGPAIILAEVPEKFEAFGLIMPVSNYEDDKKIPSWVIQSKETTTPCSKKNDKNKNV